MNSDLTIKEDANYKNKSAYQWFNIEIKNTRVGKARMKPENEVLVIYSINIFPEYERNGFASVVIDHFKSKYQKIIADRVRANAVEFWDKMGFESDHNGNHIWNRNLIIK